MPTVNRKATDDDHTQSVIFEKSAGWNEADARQWCKDHDYYTDGLDENEGQYRWRQYDPEPDKFRYRNQVIEEKDGKASIILILGYRKGRNLGGSDIEQRAFPFQEVRVAREDGQPARIEGHAAVFDQLSDDMGFRERVRPGAFTKTIREADVRALWNHNSDLVLGRTKNKTLSLAEDKRGLAISVTPPDTSWGRDAVISIERGDVDQMSFAFRSIRDEWNTEDGLLTRSLIEVSLFDVSPVTYPAYPQTDVAVRQLLQRAGIDFGALSLAISRSRSGGLTGADRALVAHTVQFLDGLIPAAPLQVEHPAEGEQERARARLIFLKRQLDLAEI